MVSNKRDYTNEGGSVKLVIPELYNWLLDGYRKLSFTDEYFEIDFVDDCAWLPKALANLKKESPPFGRGYVDYCVNELCKMEDALLNLEKSIS